jgi:hypothetical protein
LAQTALARGAVTRFKPMTSWTAPERDLKKATDGFRRSTQVTLVNLLTGVFNPVNLSTLKK